MMSQRTSIASLLLGLFLAFFMFPSVTNATALTYNVDANEKACFYIMNDKPGKKIGFYFAVKYLSFFNTSYYIITKLIILLEIGPTRRLIRY